MNALPRASEALLRFGQRLRAAGFAVSVDQSIGFMDAVRVLGPVDMTAIHRAGLALFAVPPERRAEYDAVFRAVFLGQEIAAPAEGDGEDELQAHEPTGAEQSADADEEGLEAGVEASLAEREGYRALQSQPIDHLLARFSAALPSRLPRRRSFRRRRAKRGRWLDVRRTLRDAARFDGDVVRLRQVTRVLRPRKLLLLVDVSGSMSDDTESTLRLMHAVVQGAPHAEVFTLGTRLTRITPALVPSGQAQALARAATLIGDIDGGTRLGAALQTFLAVPRYAAYARGAACTVLSDALERDDPQLLIDAVERLSRLAWRLDWLSPLAADPNYRPETQAMSALLPRLNHLGAANDMASVADHLLNLTSQP